MQHFDADLHVHSPHSIAVSKNMNLENIIHTCQMKGLSILGTGDITQPDWRTYLKSNLQYSNGVYSFKDMYFIIQTELEDNESIHHVVLLPDFNAGDLLQEKIMDKAKEARDASYVLANLSNEVKNQSLTRIAEAIWDKKDELIKSNKKDMEAAKHLLASGEINEAIIKRLKLDMNKVRTIVEMVRSVAMLDDPIGKTEYAIKLDEGMELYRVTAPIGVVAMIFESRPDALSL